MQEIQAEKSISAGAVDRLVAAHDGDVALLYLYILKNGAYDEEQAAAVLCRTLREIRAAEEKLRRMELLPLSGAPAASPAKTQPVDPAEELPQYTAEDIARRAREDSAFSAVNATSFPPASVKANHSVRSSPDSACSAQTSKVKDGSATIIVPS